MAKYTPDSKYICSIYPLELTPVTLYHGKHPDPKTGRATVYRLEPVAKGEKPFVKEISDAFENVKSLDDGKWMSKPVACEEITAHLLRHWAGNLVGVPAGASPGIMEIVNTSPTGPERQRLIAMQTAYFEWSFQSGEKKHRENDWKNITDTERMAARWLGHTRLWVDPENAAETQACPACMQTISTLAVKCYHCGTQVRALPPELAALNASAAATPLRA